MLWFGWDHAHWLGQKLNTQNLYLQADDKRCMCHISVVHEVIASNMYEAQTMVPKTPLLALVRLPQFTAHRHGEVTGDHVRRGAEERERISHRLSVSVPGS